MDTGVLDMDQAKPRGVTTHHVSGSSVAPESGKLGPQRTAEQYRMATPPLVYRAENRVPACRPSKRGQRGRRNVRHVAQQHGKRIRSGNAVQYADGISQAAAKPLAGVRCAYQARAGQEAQRIRLVILAQHHMAVVEGCSGSLDGMGQQRTTITQACPALVGSTEAT